MAYCSYGRNHKLPKVNANTLGWTDLLYTRKEMLPELIALWQVKLVMEQQQCLKTTLINELISLGLQVNFGSGSAYANSLSKYFPEVLGLMADAAINPKFSEEEIQKSKERSL